MPKSSCTSGAMKRPISRKSSSGLLRRTLPALTNDASGSPLAKMVLFVPLTRSRRRSCGTATLSGADRENGSSSPCCARCSRMLFCDHRPLGEGTGSGSAIRWSVAKLSPLALSCLSARRADMPHNASSIASSSDRDREESITKSVRTISLLQSSPASSFTRTLPSKKARTLLLECAG